LNLHLLKVVLLYNYHNLPGQGIIKKDSRIDEVIPDVFFFFMMVNFYLAVLVLFVF